MRHVTVGWGEAMKKLGLALCIGLAAVLPVSTTEAADRQPELSAAEQTQLAENLDRGLQLHEYDQAAWHVTDAAMAALPDEAKRQLRGYISTSAEDGLLTTFFGEDPKGSFYRLYSAVWTGSEVTRPTLYAPDQRVAVTADERQLILARRVALEDAAGLKTCSQAPANAIVLPGKTTGTTHVYVLTPQTTTDRFPFGGHSRIDVRDGKIVAKRAFTKGCIDLERPKAGSANEPAAIYITHLLDSVPTEIHVFTMLAAHVPVFVMTSERKLFAIEARNGQPSARLVTSSPGK
jgi:hypothetical protein